MKIYYVVTNNPKQTSQHNSLELAIGRASYLDFENEHGGRIHIISSDGIMVDFLNPEHAKLIISSRKVM